MTGKVCKIAFMAHRYLTRLKNNINYILKFLLLLLKNNINHYFYILEGEQKFTNGEALLKLEEEYYNTLKLRLASNYKFNIFFH